MKILKMFGSWLNHQLMDSRSNEVLAERVGVNLAKGILENSDTTLDYDLKPA